MATPRLIDFAREGVDCGIRYGFGDWPGLLAERLFSATLTPVCSPRLLEGPQPLQEPADLARHTLLHALDDMDDWRLWLRAAGVPASIRSAAQVRIRCRSRCRRRSAAPASRSPAARSPTRRSPPAAWSSPFDLELPSECAYYFVVPERSADQPKIQAFRDWLLDEVAAASATPRAGLAAE